MVSTEGWRVLPILSPMPVVPLKPHARCSLSAIFLIFAIDQSDTKRITEQRSWATLRTISNAREFDLLRRVKLRRLLFAPLCLITALATAYAQSNYATVRGSVFDPQHHAIVGAHIHAKEASTGAEREVVSNATGLYEIAGLQPGTYTLAVDSQGFAQASQNVVLEVGQQATLDIALRVNKDAQTVTVAASGELLKTQDASVGEVVDQRSVDSLPLNGRMLIDLVLTVPERTSVTARRRAT